MAAALAGSGISLLWQLAAASYLKISGLRVMAGLGCP
jgi:hypothetical protein